MRAYTRACACVRACVRACKRSSEREKAHPTRRRWRSLSIRAAQQQRLVRCAFGEKDPVGRVRGHGTRETIGEEEVAPRERKRPHTYRKHNGSQGGGGRRGGKEGGTEEEAAAEEAPEKCRLAGSRPRTAASRTSLRAAMGGNSSNQSLARAAGLARTRASPPSLACLRATVAL